MLKMLWRAAVHLAIGALLYAAFVNGHFDWSAPMTYVWLLLWPLMLIWYGALVILLVVGCALAVCGGWFLIWGRA